MPDGFEINVEAFLAGAELGIWVWLATATMLVAIAAVRKVLAV